MPECVSWTLWNQRSSCRVMWRHFLQSERRWSRLPLHAAATGSRWHLHLQLWGAWKKSRVEGVDGVFEACNNYNNCNNDLKLLSNYRQLFLFFFKYIICIKKPAVLLKKCFRSKLNLSVSFWHLNNCTCQISFCAFIIPPKICVISALTTIIFIGVSFFFLLYGVQA